MSICTLGNSKVQRIAAQARHFHTTAARMTRTYADAIASLNTLQSNFAIVDAIRKSGRKMNEQAIPEMVGWCRKIGYDPSEFARLNAIHIAGTKGKGSTAAFTSNILTQYIGQSNGDKTLSKIGLYTSPHLRFVRERIQINGQPLSEEQFTKYFYETWDRLEQAAVQAGLDPNGPGVKPVYFRFLTLMAFHTYMSENIDAAIIECGIGGAYDSTNVLQKPTVTGITNLGIDHVGVLGATLPEIAWHKAGIMKPDSKCFTTTTQKPEAKAVLEKVASEQNVELIYTDTEPAVKSGDLKLGLEGDFQKVNASIAAAMAREWLTKHNYNIDEQKVTTGLETAKWGGRCETRHEGNITWCIDGGHTLDSIEVAGKWFASSILQQSSSKSTSPTSPNSNPSSSNQQQPRILLFNQQTRDAPSLVSALHSTLSSTLGTSHPFTHAIFCTNITYAATGFRPDLTSLNNNSSALEELTVQKCLAEAWRAIDGDTHVKVMRTVEEAVGCVRGIAGVGGEEQEGVMVLVTGSLHLVGGVLEVLEGEIEEKEKERTKLQQQ